MIYNWYMTGFSPGWVTFCDWATKFFTRQNFEKTKSCIMNKSTPEPIRKSKIYILMHRTYHRSVRMLTLRSSNNTNHYCTIINTVSGACQDASVVPHTQLAGLGGRIRVACRNTGDCMSHVLWAECRVDVISIK